MRQLPSSCPVGCSRDTAAADTGPVHLHLLLVGPADGGYLGHQVVGVGVLDVVLAGVVRLVPSVRPMAVAVVLNVNVH